MVLELYTVGIVVIGAVLLGVAILPRFLADRAISLPIVFVGFGMLVFGLPTGLPPPDPLEQGVVTERFAEFGVIIALMGLGLKIDRPLGIREWNSTWRLLAITMPLSIAVVAILGWSVVGFLAPTAILFGACIAPTDPVLAAEVEVEDPMEGDEEVIEEHEVGGKDEVRFALSSEAGLNDGLAFPFTNLAIAVALLGLAPANWAAEWLLVDVLYRILLGTAFGVVLGWLIGQAIFASAPTTEIGESVQGLEAVAGTLLVYGITELVGGYGFIAVFVAALAIRHVERGHEYNKSLHEISELAEQIAMGFIMVFFGGAIVGGLFDPLTLDGLIVAILAVLVVRPAAGLVGLLGFEADLSLRSVISFYGIRGIGSFYYLAHALNEAPFTDAGLLWAVVGAIILISIVLHGVTVSAVVERVGRS